MKTKSPLQSRNFFVSIVSLILLAFQANKINFDIGAGEIVDVIMSKDLGAILSLAVVNLINPIMKLASKSTTWDWGFTRSANFWTQVLTVILVLIAGFGIPFPENASADLIAAWATKEFSVVAIAIILNVVNPLYHFFVKKKLPESA